MMYLTMMFTMTILVPATSGYSRGAPDTVCDSMSPGHGGSVQTNASSYTIMPSANTYDCGDTIAVTLSGSNFKGFLCQARTDATMYSTVGSLTNTDNTVTTRNSCAGEAALTHTEGGDKASFQFSWTHSGTSTDDIYIVCTVVQTISRYWEKLMSSAITYSGSATVCNGTDSGNGSGNGSGTGTDSGNGSGNGSGTGTDSGNGSENGNGSGTGPVISSVLLVCLCTMLNILERYLH